MRLPFKIKLLLIFVLVCRVAFPAGKASKSEQFGLGLILGTQTGLSAKYWLDNTHAIDAALGFGDISIHADYLWHSWNMLNQPKSGQVATYWGLGANVKDQKNENELKVRLVGGIAFYFPRHPVEIFLELVPVLILSPDAGSGIDAGMGIRYYFN